MKDWTRHPNYWRNVIETGAYWLESINAHGLSMNVCQYLFEQEHDHKQSLCTNTLPQTDRYTLADIYRRATEECRYAEHGDFQGYIWTDILLEQAKDAGHDENIRALGPLPSVPDPGDPGAVIHCLRDRANEYNGRFRTAVFRAQPVMHARDAHESETEWAPVAGD